MLPVVTRSLPIDAATVRRLSVQASVDTRSLIRRLRGETVRGLAQYRIDAILGQHGIPVPCVPKKSSDTS
jgi:hypothetical protein